MKQQQINLDEAIRALRDDEAPAGVAEAAANRVWTRVAHEAGLAPAAIDTIRGCADVLALLPAYGSSTLEESRALLVQDHLNECATCRATFQQPVGRRLAVLPWRASTRVAPRQPRSYRREALAAAAMLALAVAGFAVQRSFFGVPPGSRAEVQSVSGMLQRVAADAAPALQPGAEMAEAEVVRTAGGSRAHLKLRDGSIVEMGERAELSVSVRGRDTTIHLQRGSIIVQAAKRRAGHLLVASNDCTVSVTGTVFSVNGGLKGSRVSVIEGSVKVARGGAAETTLSRGQQWTSNDVMGRVPVRDEIAWSRDVDQHLALLGEIQALRQRWGSLPAPRLRYESRLLGLLPAETVLFASVPNYGQTLAEGYRLFQERLRESPVLQEWWANADPSRHGGPSLDDVIEKVRGFSEYLGEEVALAAAADSGSREPRPFVLAEVRRPGLREYLLAEIARLEELHGGKAPLQILDDEALASEPESRH